MITVKFREGFGTKALQAMTFEVEFNALGETTIEAATERDVVWLRAIKNGKVTRNYRSGYVDDLLCVDGTPLADIIAARRAEKAAKLAALEGSSKRNFRLPDSLYTAAQAKAEEEGETLTAVIVRALQDYTK